MSLIYEAGMKWRDKSWEWELLIPRHVLEEEGPNFIRRMWGEFLQVVADGNAVIEDDIARDGYAIRFNEKKGWRKEWKRGEGRDPKVHVLPDGFAGSGRVRHICPLKMPRVIDFEPKAQKLKWEPLMDEVYVELEFARFGFPLMPKDRHGLAKRGTSVRSAVCEDCNAVFIERNLHHFIESQPGIRHDLIRGLVGMVKFYYLFQTYETDPLNYHVPVSFLADPGEELSRRELLEKREKFEIEALEILKEANKKEEE